MSALCLEYTETAECNTQYAFSLFKHITFAVVTLPNNTHSCPQPSQYPALSLHSSTCKDPLVLAPTGAECKWQHIEHGGDPGSSHHASGSAEIKKEIRPVEQPPQQHQHHCLRQKLPSTTKDKEAIPHTMSQHFTTSLHVANGLASINRRVDFAVRSMHKSACPYFRLPECVSDTRHCVFERSSIMGSGRSLSICCAIAVH